MKKKLLFIGVVIVLISISIFVYFNIHNYSDELTIEEIDQISKSIAAVQCSTFQTTNGNGVPIFGSGTYLTIQEPQTNVLLNILLTNSHIAEDPHIRNPEDDYGLCTASFNQLNSYYFFNYYDTIISSDNKDLALLVTEKNNNIENEITALNKANKPLPLCNKVVMGIKIYVFGYPGSSDNYIAPTEPKQENFDSVGDWSQEWFKWQRKIDEYNKSRNLILTEGIISGEGDMGYFTTAKIDTGNSGGLAVAKEEGEICLVGIPTWISLGEVDNLGVIQPIKDIYQSEINWSKLFNEVEL